MNTGTIDRPVEILLVDDHPGDACLIREALKEVKVRNNLHVAKDGVEALSFLRREGRYANASRPNLILLGLSLHWKGGYQVLAEIKADERLKCIPVVILTKSNDEEDIVKSYSLHANCYITKPFGLDQFFTVVESIVDFWCTVAKLPLE